MDTINFRETVKISDIETVKDLVTSTGFFNKDEIEVAAELVKEYLEKNINSGYLFLFIELNGRTVGYSCYGHVAGTMDSYELYWIAVYNVIRGQGIGKKLLFETENIIISRGGKKIFLDTSSRSQYEPTRKFYEKNNYIIEAQLKDFYGPKDDKVIFVKRFEK